jgi:hypothetical protein
MTTSRYIDACMNALVNCENLAGSISTKHITFSTRTIKILEECTNICLGMLQALKENWHDLATMALLCVGICEECAEVCERYRDQHFQLCAVECRNCSNVFSDLAKKSA